MATPNYNLPTITGNMSADVVRDMNALAEATDDAIKQSVGEVDNRLEAHLREVVRHVDYTIASGTNTYATTINGVNALVEGMSIKVKFTNANTGAATLNVNSLGAKPIIKGNGSALLSGNVKAGQIVHLVYTGANFQLLGEGGEYGNVTPADVILGKIFGTEAGLRTGIASVETLGGRKFARGTTTWVRNNDNEVTITNIGFEPSFIMYLGDATNTTARIPFGYYQKTLTTPEIVTVPFRYVRGYMTRTGGVITTMVDLNGTKYYVNNGTAYLPISEDSATSGNNIINWFAIG